MIDNTFANRITDAKVRIEKLWEKGKLNSSEHLMIALRIGDLAILRAHTESRMDQIKNLIDNTDEVRPEGSVNLLFDPDGEFDLPEVVRALREIRVHFEKNDDTGTEYMHLHQAIILLVNRDDRDSSDAK